MPNVTQFPLEPQQVSCAGDYVRTCPFVHPAADKIAMWLEAVEHPLTCLWQVQEVICKPNLTTVGPDRPDDVYEYKPVKGLELLSLEQAIEKLAAYEHGQRTMGYVAVEEPDDTHVSVFAAMNGFAIDMYGAAHATSGGRIVTEGSFSPQAVAMARDYYGRLPAAGAEDRQKEVPWLSTLFRTAASGSPMDIDRVVNKRLLLKEWEDFGKQAGQSLYELSWIQNKSFDEISEKKFMGLAEADIVMGEKQWRSRLAAVRRKLDFLQGLPPADKKECARFFDVQELTFDVAAAMRASATFLESGRKKDGDLFREKLAAAQKTCRNKGGSERDVANMTAEITAFDGQKREVIHYFKEAGCKDVSVTAWNFSGSGMWHDVYYFPAPLVLFFRKLNTVRDRLAQLLDLEMQRLADPAQKSRGPSQN